MGRGIKLSEIAERMDLKNLTPELDLTEKEVHVPDVNRPALQLAGFLIILTQTAYRSSGM